MTDSSTSATSSGALEKLMPADVSAQRRSAIVVIVLAYALQSFGYQIWRSLFNNFVVGELGVRADQMGLIQSVREIPGLLGFSVGLLVLLMTEMRIAGLSVALLGVGIVMTGAVSNLTSLMVSTLVMSIGFHFFMSSNSSAALMLVGEDETPRLLGRLRSLGALAAVASAGVVFLALDRLGFRTLFYATGALVLVGGLALLPWTRQPALPDHLPLEERDKGGLRRIPMRRRFWLYYILEFLMGSRRHIFTTFAIFLLVETYQVTAQTITILFVVNNLAGTFLFHRFGHVINRFGERRILTFNFALLILVFLGYAYISLLPVLYVLFVADHVLFGFRIAIQSYFQKIAVRPQEITHNISLGQTINHVAAIIIPVVGGVVWETLGSRYTFLIGVGIVVLSMVLTQWMRMERSAMPE